MKKYLFLLCCLVFVEGCKENTKIQYDSKRITVEWKDNHPLLLSDIVDSIAYIPLETTNESLIGRIDKIVCTDDHIYILDSEVSTSVFVFNHLGKFISVINNKGKGSGEFMKIDDFCCDTNGDVFIYDTGLRKVIGFNVRGEFTGQEFKLNFFADFISYLDNTKTFLFYSSYRNEEDRHNVIETNKAGKIINRYMQFDKAVNDDKLIMPSINFSHINDSNISFFEIYDNNVYCYNGKEIQSNYQFDFGSFNLSSNFMTSSIDETVFRDEYSYIPKKYVILSNVQENESHIFYTAIKGYGAGVGIFSKETGENKIGFSTYYPQHPEQYSSPIKNDVNNCPNFAFYGLHKDGFCSIIEISEIKSIQHIDPNLKSLSDQLNIEENPVLMKFYLKKF